MNKQQCIIVDIDGTLMDISERKLRGKPFITTKEELPYYVTDTPNKPVVAVVNLFRFSTDIPIIFCSGRTEMSREATEAQINFCLGISEKDYTLYMRKDGDFRGDDIIKEEFLNEIQKQYDVFFTLDDRNKVVDMWRSKGIPCFQVAPGNF